MHRRGRADRRIDLPTASAPMCRLSAEEKRMNISAANCTGSVDTSAPQGILMAQKGLGEIKQNGLNALQLIQGAQPPPLPPGRKLSVYA